MDPKPDLELSAVRRQHPRPDHEARLPSERIEAAMYTLPGTDGCATLHFGRHTHVVTSSGHAERLPKPTRDALAAAPWAGDPATSLRRELAPPDPDEPVIVTFSGGRFYPFSPRVQDIRLVDIAAGISKLCRFTGQTHGFYSVAQHSVVGSYAIEAAYHDDALSFEFLTHDAHETWYGDVSAPMKRHPLLAGYKEAEARGEAAMRAYFGLPAVPSREVKLFDSRMAGTEQRDLMCNAVIESEPLADKLVAWPVGHSFRQFVARFRQLAVRLGLDDVWAVPGFEEWAA
jgi:hypothetical protein